jgi:hypothetical protein
MQNLYVIFLVQNSFPMKEWHVLHMEKTVVKFVRGLSENASLWEKRQHKRYGTVANCCRQIDYDMKHGVTHEQVLSLLNKLRHHASYSDIREVDGFVERLNEIEKHFSTQKEKINVWH